MSRWRFMEPSCRPPERPGVYVFLMNGRPFYIGSTINLRTRIRQHLAPYDTGPPFAAEPSGRTLDMRSCDVIKFKEFRRLGDWLMAEWRLINRLRPIANKRIR